MIAGLTAEEGLGGEHPFCLPAPFLHLRPVTLASVHKCAHPFALPLHSGHKKDIVHPSSGLKLGKKNAFQTLNSATKAGPPAPHIQALRTNFLKFGKFLRKEATRLQSLPECLEGIFPRPEESRFVPRTFLGGRLYTTKHIGTQCQRIFKQTSLRWEMWTAGTAEAGRGLVEALQISKTMDNLPFSLLCH